MNGTAECKVRSATCGVRCLAALALLVLAPAPAVAHRLDEYLQAARVAVASERVMIELSLTPGASLANAIIARLDRDGDGSCTPQEAERYGQAIVTELSASMDARPLALSLRRVDVPPMDEFRDGLGTIRIHVDAAVPVTTGSHVLRFENRHRPGESVYLANALLPDDARIAIRHQDRDSAQRVLDIHFEVASSPRTGLVWLVIAGAMLLVHAESRVRLVSTVRHRSTASRPSHGSVTPGAAAVRSGGPGGDGWLNRRS